MYQKVEIIGNVGRDTDLRQTPGGQSVASFSVATNRSYTESSGERIKETTWFKVTAWGKMAEFCHAYIKRGGLVFVEGRFTPDKTSGGPRIWRRQDDTYHASYEIIAQNIKLLSRQSNEEPVMLPPEEDEY